MNPDISKLLEAMGPDGPADHSFGSIPEFVAKLSVAEWLIEHDCSSVGELLLHDAITKFRDIRFIDLLATPQPILDYFRIVSQKAPTIRKALRKEHPNDADDSPTFGLGCFGAALSSAMAAVGHHDIHLAAEHGFDLSDVDTKCQNLIALARTKIAPNTGTKVLRVYEETRGFSDKSTLGRLAKEILGMPPQGPHRDQ